MYDSKSPHNLIESGHFKVVSHFHRPSVGGAYSCAFDFTESRAVPCHRHACGEPAVSTREETHSATQ